MVNIECAFILFCLVKCMSLEKKLDLYLQYICSTCVSNIICANMCYICAPALNIIFAPYAHWSVGDYR